MPTIDMMPEVSHVRRFVEVTRVWQVAGAPVLHTWSGREWTPTRLAVSFSDGQFAEVELFGQTWDGEDTARTWSAQDDDMPAWVRPYTDPTTNYP